MQGLGIGNTETSLCAEKGQIVPVERGLPKLEEGVRRPVHVAGEACGVGYRGIAGAWTAGVIALSAGITASIRGGCGLSPVCIHVRCDV
jgi:hypothetical protein